MNEIGRVRVRAILPKWVLEGEEIKRKKMMSLYPWVVFSKCTCKRKKGGRRRAPAFF